MYSALTYDVMKWLYYIILETWGCNMINDSLLVSWINFLLLTIYQTTKTETSKLKAFAGDKISDNEKLKVGMEKVENIVGKGKDAGYQYFLFFP